MNISTRTAVPQFGAVFKSKNKPSQEEALYFQHDPSMEGIPDGYYATGEDKAVLQPLTDTLNASTKTYGRIKKEFLTKLGFGTPSQISMAVSAAVNSLHNTEYNNSRKELDNDLIQYHTNVEGHTDFVKARNEFEAAIDGYLAKTAELAQKAQ